MLERSLSMRELPGSMPGFSNCVDQNQDVSTHFPVLNIRDPLLLRCSNEKRHFEIWHFSQTTGCKPKIKSSIPNGGLAQMEERSLCMREVPGSIPGSSTFEVRLCLYLPDMSEVSRQASRDGRAV